MCAMCCVCSVSRTISPAAFLHTILSPYGVSDIAVNGIVAMEGFVAALGSGKPYNLVCLDIMPPGMDGQEILRRIRTPEHERGVPPADEAPRGHDHRSG